MGACGDRGDCVRGEYGFGECTRLVWLCVDCARSEALRPTLGGVAGNEAYAESVRLMGAADAVDGRSSGAERCTLPLSSSS